MKFIKQLLEAKNLIGIKDNEDDYAYYMNPDDGTKIIEEITSFKGTSFPYDITFNKIHGISIIFDSEVEQGTVFLIPKIKNYLLPKLKEDYDV